MIWAILLVVVVVVIIALVASSSSKSQPDRATTISSQSSYVLRNGKAQKADGVFGAWTSGDLNTMLSQLDKKTNSIDRHSPLLGIVVETYKNPHRYQTYQIRETLEPNKRCYLWEDDSATLEVSTNGPQSNIMLTDKELLLQAYTLDT